MSSSVTHQGPWQESPAAPVRSWGDFFRSGMASLISLLFHSVLLIVLALCTEGLPSGSPEGEEVSIAMLPNSDLEEPDNDLELTASEADTNSLTETVGELDLMAVRPELSSGEAGLEVLLEGPAGPAGTFGSLSTAAGGGSGMAQTASFLGLQARGQRFCIIADCSGSMRGPRIEHVKREVLRTLGGLYGATRFHVTFFNSRAVPFPEAGWRRPVESELRVVQQYLARIQARGGTDPSEAFRLAFQLRPRPDTIFFMTDGQFEPRVAATISQLNTSSPIPINTITFMDRSAAAVMIKIANDSGGKYRHVGGF